jgi:hypothetical protein
VTFSLCHTTARLPDGWRRACSEWREACDDPADCEYVLCTDDMVLLHSARMPWPRWTHAINGGPRSAVAGWNCAAAASSGKFLITVSDDLSPCAHWDGEIKKLVPDMSAEAVLDVDAGRNDGLLTFSLLTRARYDKFGRIFYPDYLGMYGDDDFMAEARRDGVVLDARHLKFEHRHPAHGTAPMDEVYAWQNRPGAYELGRAVFEWRKAHDFVDAPRGFNYIKWLQDSKEGKQRA